MEEQAIYEAQGINLEPYKAKYGRIHELTVSLETGEEVKVYIQKPSRETMMRVTNMVAASNLTGAGQEVVKNHLITDISDARVLVDDEAYLSLCMASLDLIALKKTTSRVC
jgi:hypothetical protein